MTERERAYKLLTDIHFHSSSSVRAEKILAAFRDVKAEVWEEARSLLIAQQCKQPFYGSAIYKQVVVDFARWIDKLVDMFAARAAALREGRDGTDYTLLSQL